jgi:hypothetical protein
MNLRMRTGGMADSTATKGALIFSTAVFLLLAVGLYAMSWNGRAAGFLSDDAVYLLMADSFGWRGQIGPELSNYVMRQSLFPPLYPLLLATFGAGSFDLLRAHLVTTTTLVIALVIFGAWLRAQTQDRIGSTLLVVALTLLPGMLFQNLEILSEAPYLLLTLLAIWLADRPSSARWGRLPVAFCVGLAALTRTAGYSLIVAFGLWLLRQRREDRVRCFALAMVPSLVWILIKRRLYGGQAGYSQSWSPLWQELHGNLLSFFLHQCTGLWDALLANMDFWQSGVTCFAVGLTLLVAFSTWVRRLREWRLDAWYLLIGMAMLLAYPLPGFFPRLILPWLPILLFYCYSGLRTIGAIWGERSGSIAAYAYVALLFLAVAPSVEFVGRRAAEPIAVDLAHWKHTRYWLRPGPADIASATADVAMRENLIEATQQAGRLVPESDCVLGVHTAIGMLYARRVFVQPPPPSIGATEFERRIQECPYAFLVSVSGMIGGDRVDEYYPRDRLFADRAETVQVWADPANVQNPTAILLHLKPTQVGTPSVPTTSSVF